MLLYEAYLRLNPTDIAPAQDSTLASDTAAMDIDLDPDDLDDPDDPAFYDQVTDDTEMSAGQANSANSASASANNNPVWDEHRLYSRILFLLCYSGSRYAQCDLK